MTAYQVGNRVYYWVWLRPVRSVNAKQGQYVECVNQQQRTNRQLRSQGPVYAHAHRTEEVTASEGWGVANGVGGEIRVGDVNVDGDWDGAGTRTGVETNERTQDGNGDGSGDGNESSSGDGNEDGIGEGGGEAKKRKKPH